MPSSGADRDSEQAAWFSPPPPEAGSDERGGLESENLYRLIGSRWVVAVLRQLGRDTLRYNALHRRLGGVSHKVLTQTLRRLEHANVVRRRAHPTTPPNVEYELTAAGMELLDNLVRLERWASVNGLRS